MPAADDAPSPMRVGTVLKSKWRIDARIGAGGMATVYAATHRNGSRVAIKVLTKTYSRDPMARERFLREGYAANAVGHPGAVKVLDDDVTDDGAAFLVMELLDGESLEAMRSRYGGKLPVHEVLRIGDELLALLAVAHDKRIVHRDIKPENVFLTREGQVKLLDFGVAQMRSAGGNVTGAGLMLGTPDFMSPEQAGGHPDEIDGRSDLWSVGAMLFLLLSGETVHVSTTLRDHLIATATKPARPLGAVAAGVPPAVAQVIDRALCLDKADRWPDARAMRKALGTAQHAMLPRAYQDGDDAEPTEYKPMKFSEPPSAAEERMTALAATAQLPQGLVAEGAASAATPVVQVRTARMPSVKIAAASAAAPPAPPLAHQATLQGHATETRHRSIARQRVNRALVVALVTVAALAAGVAGWLVSGRVHAARAPEPNASGMPVPDPAFEPAAVPSVIRVDLPTDAGPAR